MFPTKSEELDRTIEKLHALREDLRHAAACPAPSHGECPNFRRHLQSAAGAPLTGTKPRSKRPR